MFCKTYDESLQKQAVNMDLQCILCIANSSYAVKTPKDKVTCDTYWNFYKKLKIWTCFPQNRRFWHQTGDNLSKWEGWNIWNGRMPCRQKYKTKNMAVKILILILFCFCSLCWLSPVSIVATSCFNYMALVDGFRLF